MLSKKCDSKKQTKKQNEVDIFEQEKEETCPL